MAKKIRRVVTGHTPEGNSVFVSDAAPPRVVTISGMKDFSITAVWATDHGMTAVPGSADPTPAMTTFVPGEGGTRFLITVLPPASQGLEPGTDPAAVSEEMLTKLPGLAQAMEPDQPGMHTTDTVDYDIIISGELWLELDDGKEVRLKPGDIVIQNGTRHAWRNKGTKPCVMYSVLVGAPRR
jgi:mannose-6-phosphate isomerase-like protein (cupin superfamily)